MENSILLLMCLCYSRLHFTNFVSAQVITQPPESTTAALDTNATFTCHGTDSVLWQINGSRVQDPGQLPVFAGFKIFVPLPRQSFSKLIITATRATNATRLEIICLVDPGIGMGDIVLSDPVQLLVYAEPNPPTGLMIDVDGLDLVATWDEPFSLEGEDLFYIITIMNRRNVLQDEVTVNTTRFVLSEPIGERDCTEYVFTVFSRNGFSQSLNAVTGRANIPTEPLVMISSDVTIQVSLTSGVSTIISFIPRDPCPSYPVISYNFTITERDTGRLVDSVRHTSNLSLIVDSSNDLVPDQVYQLTVEAENRVGSTKSEDEILLYTTGLQSSVAVMELNGSITVTCNFATGASSTGCQVTVFMRDNSADIKIIFSRNITRPNGANQVMENMLVPGLSENSVLLVRVAELLQGGSVSDALFENMVVVASLPSTTSPTMVPTTTTTTVQGTPTPFGSTFYFIIGAVGGPIVILLLLIILSICVIVVLRSRRSKMNHLEVYGISGDGIDAKPNEVYGINKDGIETKPNKVYGINSDGIETTPNDVYGINIDGIETTPNEVYGVNSVGIPNEVNCVDGHLYPQDHEYELVKL